MHRNARLTLWGRRELVDRIAAGRPVAQVAEEMNVSRATGYKWWRRFQAEGYRGLEDRSSRPRRSPRQTPDRIEQRIVGLRRERKWGPLRIAWQLGLAASTVHRVLVRAGCSRLVWMDRPTGRTIRRYERARPGELVHVDVKKLGRLGDGGGWRADGRQAARTRKQRRIGYEYAHSAIDDHSRLAYTELHNDQTASTCAAFLERAVEFFAAHAVHVERVLTDNAFAYVHGAAFHRVLDDHGIGHRRIKPYRPQTNGKVERFNRTLLDEWAYQRPYTSNTERRHALNAWLIDYNYTRPHGALAGKPPASRVNNLPGQYI